MSEAATAVARSAEFQVVGIEQVQESKTNPRKHFAKDALSDLTKSIAEKGILVPLLVRQAIGDNVPAGHYEILAGARRYRAAKAAGLKQVPILIRQLDDEQALEVQVIENLQRQDVHPLEEAEGYKQLLAKGKYDVEALAAKVGKSTRYIYARMQLAELTPAVKKAFEEDKITAGHAILLARLQPEQQKEGLEYCLDKYRRPSVRDLMQWIDREVHLDLGKAPWKKADAELLPAAGACTTCQKRTGAKPALFPEIKNGDTCTDPQCFKQKLAALVQIRVKESPGVQLVTTSYGYSANEEKALEKTYPGVAKAGSYVKAGAIKCKDTTDALVVDGDGVGTRLKICTAKRCKKHGISAQTYQAPKRSAKEIESAKRADAKRAFEEKVEKVAFVEAIGNVRKMASLPRAIWPLLAVAVWGDAYGEDDYAIALGQKENLTEKKIAKFDQRTAIAYLFAAVMDPQRTPSKSVLEAVRLAGVDVSKTRKKLLALEKEVKAQTAAKKSKKAA